MRTLGLTLVVASLVLGSGGVAYRTHAGEGQEQVGMTLLETGQESCELPQRMRLRLPNRASAKRMINLSNRGMNYRGLAQQPMRPDAPPASPRD